MCKRSVDEPMMGIPDRPESWPASRFFAVLGPAANVAQGSGTVVGRGVVSATPTATDHAHATLLGVTSNSPAVSPSSSHQPAELSAQPASQRVHDSTASHQRNDPRVERCACHAISKRHIMPKASDTTPSEGTTHIIHHHGLHRPSTRLDKTESDETERLVKREERPDQDKLEGTLSQLANERVIPVMADAHNSTNQFYYDTSALKKDEKCRFKGGDDFVDPSKTNRASLAYFGPQHLFKGKQARSQFIRSGAAQGDAFYFPRQDAAHNEEDTRLYNKGQVENAASLRQLNSCPAGERDEPLQQIGSRAQETSDWQAGNKFAVLERTGDSAEGKEAEPTIKKSYTPVAPVARAHQQPRRASPQRAPAAPPHHA